MKRMKKAEEEDDIVGKNRGKQSSFFFFLFEMDEYRGENNVPNLIFCCTKREEGRLIGFLFVGSIFCV